jgi:CHAD domain-containing protein
VRDRQVQREYFTGTLATLPPEHVLGSVAADIEQTLLGEELRARTVVTEVMAGERYRALLALLTEWAARPPVVADAEDGKLRDAIAAAEHKADKRLKQGIRAREDEPLHRARKAAKRARYAAELGRPVLGKAKSKRQVKHYKKIQTELGDHQDAAVAAETLWRLGARTGTSGSANGFTYGLLFAREQARGAAAVAAVRGK